MQVVSPKTICRALLRFCKQRSRLKYRPKDSKLLTPLYRHNVFLQSLLHGLGIGNCSRNWLNWTEYQILAVCRPYISPIAKKSKLKQNDDDDDDDDDDDGGCDV